MKEPELDRGPESAEQDVLVVSVGGTPEPIIYTILEQRPWRIIFFASSGTREIVDRILSAVGPYPHAIVVTPDEQNLEETFTEALYKLPSIFQEWKVEPGQVLVDYTGGTKVMSAALVLATADYARRYSYVGGSKRESKADGAPLGTVVSGAEQTVLSGNPWMRSAIRDVRRIGLLAQSCQFPAALDLARARFRQLERGSAQRHAFGFLAETMSGYAAWDRLRLGDAREQFRRALRRVPKLERDAWPGSMVARLQTDVSGHVEYLNALLAGMDSDGALVPTRELALDLVGNACRRARREQKYEDAVARLYRATEALGQALLRERGFGSTKEVPAEKIGPEIIRSLGLDEHRPTHQLALRQSYQLLEKLGDETGIRFIQADKVFRELRFARHTSGTSASLRGNIANCLDMRNGSIGAHGFQAVQEESFDSFLEAVLGLFGVSENDLPRFPDFTELGTP